MEEEKEVDFLNKNFRGNILFFAKRINIEAEEAS